MLPGPTSKLGHYRNLRALAPSERMPRPSRPNVQALTTPPSNATTSKLAPLPRERVRSRGRRRGASLSPDGDCCPSGGARTASGCWGGRGGEVSCPSSGRVLAPHTASTSSSGTSASIALSTACRKPISAGIIVGYLPRHPNGRLRACSGPCGCRRRGGDIAAGHPAAAISRTEFQLGQQARSLSPRCCSRGAWRARRTRIGHVSARPCSADTPIAASTAAASISTRVALLSRSAIASSLSSGCQAVRGRPAGTRPRSCRSAR